MKKLPATFGSMTEDKESNQGAVEIRPLSVNMCWQGRRFKTPEYKAYERETLLLLPKRKMIKGNVEVYLIFFFKNDKMRDIDNSIKPILDFFTKKGYIEDDRKIIHLDISKQKSEREGFAFEIMEVR